MQIVVPMSGFGERFRRAGYSVPKPLIIVEGKPIIAHVIDMFPGETDFIFICNADHLAEPAFAMRETLQRYCPTGRIVAIPAHKLGPVNAVLMAREAIDPFKPTLFSYCDFTCVWDWAAFKRMAEETECDGAIACYTGFHPHMLHSVNYAYVKERDLWVEDIQEKKPWTDTPMREYASSGSYYFRSGALALHMFERSMARPELALNGEFYISLAYKPLLESGGRVRVFDIPYFMQWGTPDDLAEFKAFADAFRRLASNPQHAPKQAGTVMIPMAGAGSRFVQEGYDLPKPLIQVSGKPMVTQATADLPRALHHTFILRKDLAGLDAILARLRLDYPECRTVILDQLTDGQARTCLLGMEGIDLNAPLTIGACDNGLLYDPKIFEGLFSDLTVDVIVWGARGYPGARRSPKMYGWIDAADGHVRHVSVKIPLGNPACDPIVVGAFTFRRARDFVTAATRMIARDGRVNSEFYVDECINDAIKLDLDVRLFDVDSYLCWGTPNDLKTFEYWQAAFDLWASSPYSKRNDSRFALLPPAGPSVSSTLPG